MKTDEDKNNNFIAKWIASPAECSTKDDVKPLPFFRKVFKTNGTIERTHLRFSCGGYYKLKLNGKPITDSVLCQVPSIFDKTVFYDDYVVTDLLLSGDNIITVELGNGWYNMFGTDAWEFMYASWHDKPKMLMQLDIVYCDKSVDTVVSDKSWKVVAGPTVFEELRSGEHYDARIFSDWDNINFDDESWINVEITAGPGGNLVLNTAQPIRKIREINAVSITKVTDGKYVYDFGENITGWVKLSVCGEAGSQVTMRFSEQIYEDGNINVSQINSFAQHIPFQTNKYILSGNGNETWEPSFTYHGFRYVELSGFPAFSSSTLSSDSKDSLSSHSSLNSTDFSSNTSSLDPKTSSSSTSSSDSKDYTSLPNSKGYAPSLDTTNYTSLPDSNSLVACVVHSDLNERGFIKSENLLINQLQLLTKRSTLGNFFYFPTDCPHREKNGWTGDAALSCEQTLFNFDPVDSYKLWLISIRDTQRSSGQLPGIVPTAGYGYNWGSGPAWDMVLFVIPWSIYLFTNDIQILTDNSDAFLKYLHFLESMTDNGIVEFGLEDWVPPSEIDGNKCPVKVSDTILSYYMATTASKIALIVGNDDMYNIACRLSEQYKNAFCEKLFDSSTGVVLGECQTAQAMAIFYEIINPEDCKMAVDVLLKYIEEADWHISCGILGSRVIFHVLSSYGYADIAWKMISQKTYPSYGYWVECGATTLWETWEGKNSLNHHFFGDISAWFYKGLAGINYDKENPGFGNVLFKPHPVEEIGNIKATYMTSHGEISAEWKYLDKCTVEYKVNLPVGCTGTICVPVGWEKQGEDSGCQGSQRCPGSQGTDLQFSCNSGTACILKNGRQS